MHCISRKGLSLKGREMEGNKSVEENREELEFFTLRISLEEDKDASIARLLRGLNRDIVNQSESYPYTTYEDMCHLDTKIDQRKRIGFSKTNLPSSRSVVPIPQESTYKSLPKKEDTPKVAFKDPSKPNVEEKRRLITSLTRCFKYNSVGHIAINYPTKRTLVLVKI
ncbi:hypothetical protein M9H77_16726 [Catharanthus roseus]|uniref:Uncharacterized protein n=1 Tax=Catharanthus roseus TaxID=4058 RepID=A0ACC0B2K1_CATRO|nr:hypothetical protein M9H77_16726 [Catharanthus roseus]